MNFSLPISLISLALQMKWAVLYSYILKHVNNISAFN
jgi:Na+-transporting NADH:ubiquinone oxidoreductase subunit NqrB